MHPLAADLRTDLEAVAREAAMVATALSRLGEAGTGHDEALRWLAVGGIASGIEKTCGGIERALRRVAAEVDGHVPRDEAWHATLLLRMGSPLPGVRGGVPAPETLSRLDMLRAFRHRERKSYAADLDPVRVLAVAGEVAGAFAADLGRFTTRSTPTADVDVIPAPRSGDGRGQPGKVGGRAGPAGLGEGRVPRRAGRVRDGLVAAGGHAAAQPAVAQALPRPLGRIGPGAVRGRVDQGRVRRHARLPARVPAGPVEHGRGARPGRDRARRLGEEDARRRGRGLGQRRRDARAALRAGRPDRARRGEAPPPRPARARPLPAPDAREAALPPGPRLAHGPQPDPSRPGAPVRRLARHAGRAFSSRAAPPGRPRGGPAGSSAARGRGPRAAGASRPRGGAPRAAPRPGRAGRGRAGRRGRRAPGRGRAAPGLRGGPPPFVEGAGAAGAGPVARARHARRVVAVGPVPERPAGRAGEPRRLPARRAVGRAAGAGRRAPARPSRSRRARRRGSAGSRSVRTGKGAGTAAPPRGRPPERLGRPIDPSPVQPAGMRRLTRAAPAAGRGRTGRSR